MKAKQKCGLAIMLVLLFALVARSMVQESTITALWDFQHMNPSSLKGIHIEGSQDHVASNQSGIQMFVIAKSGKFAVRANDVQVNANTYLRIPVKSTADVVTVVANGGYYHFKIGAKAATSNTTTYTATSSDVSKGYVELAATETSYIHSIKVVQNNAGSSSSSTTQTESQTSTTKATAKWDFANVNPSSLSGLTIEGKQGRIPSTLDGITIYCIAQYGKFAQRTNDAQFNAKTALRVPVTTTSDVVTVTSATGYHNYNVGGVAATADVTNHTATAAEVSAGYVVIYATGSSYLKSISVVLNKYSAPSSSSSSSDDNKTDNSTESSGSFTAVSQNYYVVKAGSASSFLAALKQANASKSSGRKYIFLPNGTYDLGTTCLTAITGNNISIIGQSMDKTIIRNAPDVANEGIGTTATLLNQGQNTYLQDLTLKNALNYYNATSAGRAVCLQDKGNNTICKNVRMLSYQDTYYSANRSGKFYFEGCDIHGTVDFICGGGDVFFNKCTLTVEKRTASGKGSCVIAAPYTESTWGYVFNDCKIVNNAESYSLGRAWGGKPRAAYINTTLSAPTKIIASRFTAQGMNVIADKFVEYRSVNSNGTVVSPSSNKVKFYQGSNSATKETIISSAAAKDYAIGNVFGSWKPYNDAAQLTLKTLSQNGNSIQWGKVSGASSYAIFKDGTLLTIVGSATTSYAITATGTYSVRASNPNGGFGPAKNLTVSTVGSSSSSSSSSSSTSANGLSKYDANAPVGWGTVGGTITGSGDRNAVVVTTAADLVSAMSGTDAKTIYIKGIITFDGQLSVNGAQNKTVYGLPGSVLINPTHTDVVKKTGILMIKNSKNIILRNITFKGSGAYDIDGEDNLTLQNSQYIWVDHCDFQDAVDGNFDCNNASDNICVTWCRFRYLKAPYAGGSGGSNDHRFSDLWGGSDKNTKDLGKLRTTFANCWWDEGCKERQPRVRYGLVHIVNCLYSSSVSNYCVGAAYRSNIYVENSAFTSANAQKTPWKVYATAKGYTDYNITVKGCYGAADVQQRSGSIAYFIPSAYYKLTAYPASEVKTEVSAHAGATLNISAPSAKAKAAAWGESTTAINDAEADGATVVSTVYYSANGVRQSSLQHGLNIVKTHYSNGKTTVRKVMVK